jgi:hypothetical protein
MEYDYERYQKIMYELLNASWRDPEDLEIGRDISDIPEVKIIFDGYGDLEDEDENGEYRYTEGGNTNMESYAIFIHRGAIDPEFIFPEHELTPWALIHRPKEEVCIYAWYDVEAEEWTINQLDDHLASDEENGEMTAEEVMVVLEHLYEYYFKPWEGKFENDPTAWPFK